MKILFVLLGSFFLSGVAKGQVYDHQIGTATSRELLTDGIIVGVSTFESSIAVGITNVGGHDQVLVTGLSNAYGNMLFQKRHQVIVPGGVQAKTKTVITSVKIANDPNTNDNTSLIAGSYSYSNLSQTIYYSFGVFTAVLDETTGNLSNIKRWDCSITNVDGVTLSAANAGPGNIIYLTGNIHLQTGTVNRQFAMAINGTTNNLVWSTIFYDAAYNGSLYPSDIVHSPYQPSGVNEVVVAGTTRPTNTSDPKKAFLTRLNAATGAIIANSYIGDNTTFGYGVSAIIPSKSSGGVPDGFLVCGNSPNISAQNSAWVFKVSPACNALIWNKEYNNLATNGEFTSSDIAEAHVFPDANSYYVSGSTFSSVAGTTYDASIFKITADGNIIRFFSYVPPVTASNKHEYCGRVVPSSIYVNGICLFGTRVEPSNPLLSDMFTARLLDDGISCQFPVNRSSNSRNLTHTATSFTMTPVGNMINLPMNNTPTNFTGFTTHCYDDMLVGSQAAQQTQRHAETVNTVGVFPNPANETVVLQISMPVNSDENPISFRLLDMSGRVILEQQITATQTSIDVKALNNGIYFYQILQQGQKTDMGRIIISH